MSSGSDARTQELFIVFVCSGNICRSPMAEIIVRDAIENAGLADDVLVGSCGIGGWHVGEPADSRAQKELAEHGYDPSHTASQLGRKFDDATLFVAMDAGHVSGLKRYGIPSEKIRLMRSFDPDAPRNAEVKDPYYGGTEGFVEVREQIEAASAGIVEWVRQTLEVASAR